MVLRMGIGKRRVGRFKRKYVKSGTRKRKIGRNIPTGRGKMQRYVRKAILGMAERKDKAFSWGKVELYHNSGTANTVIHHHINGTTQMPTEGSEDKQRNGTQIYVKGFSVKMLLSQKQDRPNVTFRVIAVSAALYNQAMWGTSYSVLFKNDTGNGLLDPIDTDKWKIRYQKFFKWNDVPVSTGHEITRPISFWIPEYKKYTFESNTASLHDQDAIFLAVLVYDAYGTLQTDNLAYMQTWTKMYYKDP